MKCQNCGYESKNLEYCPVCGEKIEGFVPDALEEEVIKEEKIDERVEAKVEQKATYQAGPQYKVFAIVGYVLGLSSLILAWVPFMFFNAIAGLIFSKVGNKPTNKQQFAKKGHVLSLIALIVNIVFTILFYVLVVISAIELSEYYS